MTQENVDQNRLILKLRDEKKLSWQEILDELIRQGLSSLSGPASVKMKYYAVKGRQGVSKPAKQQPGKLALEEERATEPATREAVKPERKKPIKPEKQIPLKPESQKRVKVTFQIPENLFIQIKIKAARERKRISDLVGEIFKQYLKGVLRE